MPLNFEQYLVIAVSSRALFDLELENRIYDEQGLEAYRRYQMEHEGDILHPGSAFRLVRNILRMNSLEALPRKAEVIILSRNNAECALRITNSLEHYELPIIRSAWTSGTPISHYLKAFNVDLFLSAEPSDVQEAIGEGIAAARIIPTKEMSDTQSDDLIRIAFDGDAVLFSDESERIYKQHGLDAFLDHERKNAQNPLPDGPFAKLMRSLAVIQQAFPIERQPIRTALITARNSPAHERVLKTLSAWNVRVDEVFFLGGMEKHEIVRAFNPDFYFDDQDVYCDAVSQFSPTGQVPWIRSGLNTPPSTDANP